MSISAPKGSARYGGCALGRHDVGVRSGPGRRGLVARRLGRPTPTSTTHRARAPTTIRPAERAEPVLCPPYGWTQKGSELCMVLSGLADDFALLHVVPTKASTSNQ